MILCIGVLCVAVLVPVVGRKKVSSEVRRAAVVMILVSALAILAQISEEMESGGIELELVRPSYGEGDYEEEMTVDAEGILDGYSYQVVVPERILSKQEEQKLLEAAQQEIDDEFVKNNWEVQEKAEIRKNYQEGAVSADWEFEPYDVVDDEGRVVEENIPENGILVKAAVTLRCESSECISERYFRVMPKELDEEHKMIREIENYLKKQSADPGDSIKLPEQLNGKKLIWNTKKEHLSEKILFLGGGIVIILPFVEQSRKKEREKKRKALLELQYADMVSNLVLLLGAGMTVSKAWNRLTENYMNERQKRTICRKEVYEEMQRMAPLELAESWDNPGLLVDCGGEVSRVLVALDVTAETLAEAEQNGCQLIVTHHPVIFHPLKKLSPADLPFQLVQKGISAICMHTNLDAAEGGVNEVLAGIFGMKNWEPFAGGCGRVGEVEPITVPELARKARVELGARCNTPLDGPEVPVKYADTGKPVRRLAVISGAGGGLFEEALAMEADCLLTGEADHHDALDAKRLGLSIVAASHYATEFPVAAAVAQKLRAAFPAVEVLVSTANRDPFTYL